MLFFFKIKLLLAPIDLLVQSGILGQKHNVTVIDAMVEKLTYNESINKIVKVNPQVILCVTGISSFVSDFAFFKNKRNS